MKYKFITNLGNMSSVGDIIIQLMQEVAASDTDTNNPANVQEMPIGTKSDGDAQFYDNTTITTTSCYNRFK